MMVVYLAFCAASCSITITNLFSINSSFCVTFLSVTYENDDDS